MATAIGTDTLTALTRRHIMSEVVDNVYGSNPVSFRLLKANKKLVQGGTHIEIPSMYRRFVSGGSYSGYDLLPTAPSDTVKNLAFDWSQYEVPVALDGLTLIKNDSPESVASILSLQFQQSEMEMAENIAEGLWSDGTDDPKGIVGLGAAVDDGTNVNVYAGINRTTDPWHRSTVDSTATMTIGLLNSVHMEATIGGKSPTLIASRREQYNRYYALVQAHQEFPVAAGGHDEQLASAGFTNLLFNNVPWVSDDHVPDGADSSNSAIFMLNENFLNIVVSPRADFYLQPFQTPVNQDAMVSHMFWAGALTSSSSRVHAKLDGVNALPA